MLVSPVVFAAIVVGAVQAVRRVTLSASALAYEARLAKLAVAGMLPCLAAAGWWVLASRTGASDVFRAGSLDLLLIASMAATLAVAHAATQRLQLAPARPAD